MVPEMEETPKTKPDRDPKCMRNKFILVPFVPRNPANRQA